ncbi:hypothetical protein GJ744_010021 [Endocarpon pusillum]|uniref:Uncharacterized protein n=1 Tax=Endocarpon pusillum TaxID=364733 RepID=A0A8H7AHA8_9EURO|nr:hypothetical protein GJ744_010021 [Endocarpon pusillum]
MHCECILNALQKDWKKNVKNHVSNKYMDKVKLRKDRGGDLRQREKEELEAAFGGFRECVEGLARDPNYRWRPDHQVTTYIKLERPAPPAPSTTPSPEPGQIGDLGDLPTKENRTACN